MWCERVPAADQPAALQVVLLHRGVDQRTVVRAAVPREVERDVLVGRHPGVLTVDHELVQRQHPAAGRVQPRDRLVVLVDDDVFAAFGRARVRHLALPPGEHRPAFVALRAEVRRDELFAHGLEPHRLQLAVEDQRPALPLDRRFVEVVEVGGEDVARARAARRARRGSRGISADAARGAGEAEGVRGRVLAERSAGRVVEDGGERDRHARSHRRRPASSRPVRRALGAARAGHGDERHQRGRARSGRRRSGRRAGSRV